MLCPNVSLIFLSMMQVMKSDVGCIMYALSMNMLYTWYNNWFRNMQRTEKDWITGMDTTYTCYLIPYCMLYLS